MKRTITGWILNDNLNKPFLVEYTSGKISTITSIKKTEVEKYYIHEAVRVKITVETVEPKKRTPNPFPCDFCGNVPTLMFVVDKWWYHCKHCGNTHPQAHSKAEAVNAWNKLQKGNGMTAKRFECLQDPSPDCPRIYVRDNHTGEVVGKFCDDDCAKNIRDAKDMAEQLNRIDEKGKA